jgi:hypothetical protein
MSCCDGALIYINNQTSSKSAATVTINSITTDNSTTLSGLTQGQTIASNASASGSVQSAKGSNGAAEGQIVIGVGTQTFTLNYNFKPRNEFGHCPCNPSGSASPQSAGGYKINVKTTTGENSGSVLNFYVNS